MSVRLSNQCVDRSRKRYCNLGALRIDSSMPYCAHQIWTEEGYASNCDACRVLLAKVPRVVQEVEREMVPQMREVGTLISDVFFGDFWSRNGFTPSGTTQRGTTKPQPPMPYRPSAPT